MLRKIMTHLGYEPIAEKESYIQYMSPFNTTESTASFFILKSNTGSFDYCKDHSTGEKGFNYIELLKRKFNLSTREAYKKSDEIVHGQVQPMPKDKREFTAKKTKNGNDKAVLLGTSELTGKYLLEYLCGRGIYGNNFAGLLQVNYLVGSKSYSSIGIRNESGGYNHRNKHVKGILGKADISVINLTDNTETILVFEGMIDYLTHVEINGGFNHSCYIIMNSTSHARKTIDKIKNIMKYQKIEFVYLYLDNGTSGDLTSLLIIEEVENVVDCRKEYSKFDDLNDMHTNTPKTKREYRIIKKENKYHIYHTGKHISTKETLKKVKKELNLLKNNITT
jgi:hypothetical protein